MLGFGLIDGIIKEPVGGAHADPDKMAKVLKKHIKGQLDELMSVDPEELVNTRIAKYEKMGNFKSKK